MIRPLIRNIVLPAPEVRAQFDALLERALAAEPNTLLHYDLPVPKHLFLSYLCDWRGYVAHGSPRGDLDMLVPQRNAQRDISEFGCRTQVFASPDAVWALWFALLDRRRTNGTANSCELVIRADEQREKHYWFAVASDHLGADAPLANGYVYICHSRDFPDRVREAAQEWGSTLPVQPVFRMAVAPGDFPYADAILGYDHARLRQRIEQGTHGFPWFQDRDLWVIRPERYQNAV